MAIESGGIDFGSQVTQLIARRVREASVYAALLPYVATLEQAQAAVPDFRGVILSGGAASVYEPGAPYLPDWVLKAGVPVLGICYGMQLITHALGGKVAPSASREYGKTEVQIQCAEGLLAGLDPVQTVWMSHGDRLERPAEGFKTLASSDNAPFAAIGDVARGLYGVQFHPEVMHTAHGTEMLRNFVIEVCGAQTGWTPQNVIDASVEAIRAQVGDERVLLGMSGGVDSAVAGALIHRAVGDQLVAVFVNHGMLRKGEAELVVEATHNLGWNLVAVDATEEFLDPLRDVTDPEQKRVIIGKTFADVFEREASRVGQLDWLAQGTIYPDVIESAGTGRPGADRIKSHHNVGGLPEHLKSKLVEPLRELFKDEVRAVGSLLGLPDEIVWRQPFPGPGLGVRCVGEVTWERLETLRAADDIFLTELRAAGLMDAIAQAFAILLPVRSVGVMGDNRTYDEVIALRAVTTTDFMTADWARIPDDVLAHISSRIVNEVKGVNRVLYDVSTKPPATIEWE
ncbi:MAG TPA: glutamine-hydrolyzing GMP synthase [Aggregatilinea sp.]|uniref:glutamine-hydrolyzing GMP synthase n=1 Tax=Aggregatilinea sp. TaxID=2806333 RepID=UPI002B928095|nr:glutamine-hydrolyzing GMP synthase [Aggregatilinea sp.]HML24415.1 glutamine-hydrolyzing GMP synthase [Aggregatilinea sp.]